LLHLLLFVRKTRTNALGVEVTAMTDTHSDDRLGAPPALLAIIQAARIAGDRGLEQAARRQLAEEHGIDVVFRRSSRQRVTGVAHGQ
jgi:hypothetical protein